MSREHLDARRLLCPLPVIRVQDHIRTLATGDILEVVCTDPGVVNDIPAWCRLNGHSVCAIVHDGNDIVITIEVGQLG